VHARASPRLSPATGSRGITGRRCPRAHGASLSGNDSVIRGLTS
jgi:hypothetical protein